MKTQFIYTNEKSIVGTDEFIYTNEKSIVGTDELIISALSVDDRRIALTGAVAEIEKFGITAEELAVFAGSAESIHFELELVCIPLCGTRLNDRAFTEQFAVLTAISIDENGEVVKVARISRVVSRW